MFEIVNKQTREIFVFPTPDFDKPATNIDTLKSEPLTEEQIKAYFDFKNNFKENHKKNRKK